MQTKQTKLKKLAKKLNFSGDLYFKREDQHPLLSHKGRSLPTMITTKIKMNQRNFVISSSGNAALAAALYIKKYNKTHSKKLSLTIFVGEKILSTKLQKLKKLADRNIILEQVTNPKQSAFLMDKNKTASWLRQSNDDNALIGYESLAKELSKIKNLRAVFVPTSSGTTALGLHLAFKKLKRKIAIHIAQTNSVYPMVAAYIKETDCRPEEVSLAGAIVDKIALRKTNLSKAIKDSHGFGYAINNEELRQAVKLAKESEGIEISYNSALSVAALSQALKSGIKFKGAVACLITGE